MNLSEFLLNNNHLLYIVIFKSVMESLDQLEGSLIGCACGRYFVGAHTWAPATQSPGPQPVMNQWCTESGKIQWNCIKNVAISKAK